MNDADNFSMDFDDSRKLAFGCPGNVELDPPVLSVYLASALTNVVEAERDESERLRVVIRESFESYDCRRATSDKHATSRRDRTGAQQCLPS